MKVIKVPAAILGLLTMLGMYIDPIRGLGLRKQLSHVNNGIIFMNSHLGFRGLRWKASRNLTE